MVLTLGCDGTTLPREDEKNSLRKENMGRKWRK